MSLYSMLLCYYIVYDFVRDLLLELGFRGLVEDWDLLLFVRIVATFRIVALLAYSKPF
jgi:hypothetical protein